MSLIAIFSSPSRLTTKRTHRRDHGEKPRRALCHRAFAAPNTQSRCHSCVETLGISVMINPELEAAPGDARTRFPGAFVEPLQMDSFISLNTCCRRIRLAGLKLRSRESTDVLICMIIRDEEIIIPHGFHDVGGWRSPLYHR